MSSLGVAQAKPPPTPQNFAAFIPYACLQLQAPFDLAIQEVTIAEYVSKQTRPQDQQRGKSKRALHDIASATATSVTTAALIEPQHTKETSSTIDALALGGAGSSHDVVMTVKSDSAGRLVELQFHRCEQIPTLLLRIIALCVPYHPALARITVRWGPPAARLVSEIAGMLPASNITDLCLDDSPALEGNYHTLLGPQTRLRSLSLARCLLGDEECERLARRLRHNEPAARTLATLNLACNAVSDVGVAAVADALRTNRTLRSLDLAGNRITDDGARNLLRCLGTFRLTSGDLAEKRKRHIDHLRRREAIYAQCLNELMSGSGEKPERGPPGAAKKKAAGPRARQLSRADAVSLKTDTLSSLTLKAEAMADERLGAMLEPFDAEHTVVRADGGVHCVGNLVLCHLDLAYNALGPLSLALLLRVLAAQAEAARARGRGAGTGLLRVRLEGNPLPADCAELDLVSELLDHALGTDALKQYKRNDRQAKKK